MIETTQLTPDWVSPPGETIADILAMRNLTEAELSVALDHSHVQTQRLLSGALAITDELAGRLQSALGPSASFWLNRESRYRHDLARLAVTVPRAISPWIKELPTKDMLAYGWIPTRGDLTQACLRFFDIPNVTAWRKSYAKPVEAAAFRTSAAFASCEGAVAAWLRQGEIESENIQCKPWNAERFHSELSGLRALTRKKKPSDFIPELQQKCSECGVAVVIVRAPNGCRASGATRFISDRKALILLSFRYLSDDHFWFTFFHEAAHLLLHKEMLFLEGEGVINSKEEQEANAFAAEILIPSDFKEELLSLTANSFDVIRFARKVGVSPGIVVGQLQYHKRLRQNQLNTLKRRFQWSAD